MYSLELDKLRREKEEQKNRAERLEDKASALQVPLLAWRYNNVSGIRHHMV